MRGSLGLHKQMLGKQKVTLGIFLKPGVLICFPGRFFCCESWRGSFTGAISPAIWAIYKLGLWTEYAAEMKIIDTFPQSKPLCYLDQFLWDHPQCDGISPVCCGSHWETLDLRHGLLHKCPCIILCSYNISHVLYYRFLCENFYVYTVITVPIANMVSTLFPLVYTVNFYVNIYDSTLYFNIRITQLVFVPVGLSTPASRWRAVKRFCRSFGTGLVKQRQYQVMRSVLIEHDRAHGVHQKSVDGCGWMWMAYAKSKHRFSENHPFCLVIGNKE